MTKNPYSHRDWRKLSLAIRRAYPLCPECLKMGRLKPSKHIDHSTGFKTRDEFWGLKCELRPMCVSCHSKKTWDFDKKQKMRDDACKPKEFDI